jgi:small-conductance mechanosensitive channel
MSDLRFAIDSAFRKHDIHIPFPQRDIHIIQANTTEPPEEDGANL